MVNLQKLLTKMLQKTIALDNSKMGSYATGTGGRVAQVTLHKDSVGYYIAIWEEGKSSRTGYIRLTQ